MITCNILFSGIGAQEAALKRLGLNFKVIGISEIDKYAIQSYEAINGPTHNYGDITQIERLDYADLWTYSSPCQDFSMAGKQKGIYNADGSLTRSGLLKHVERLLTDSVLFGTQPKYLLMENVKGLVSKKFKPDFLNWLDKLEQLGYNNYWQVLNAKDYGIPQNRERVFVVSIRKDVDTKGYKFPSPVPLQKRLKDMLEPQVDEKYYLSADKVDKFLNSFQNPEISYCLDANYWKGTTIQSYLKKHRRQLVKEPLCAASRGRNPENPSDRTAGNPTEQMLEINYTGCTNTLTTVQKDNYVVEPFIADDTQGFDGVRYYDNYSPTLRSERSGLKVVEPSGLYIHDSDRFRKKPLKGLSRCLKAEKHDAAVIQVGNIVDTGNWDNPQRGRIYSPSGCSPALTTMQGGGLEPKIVEQYRIRKLTPRECWRLMGFTDVEFDCAKLSGISNTQLYKQAGNSIVVDVLVGIFKELFNDRL